MRVALVSLETTRHKDTASTRRIERIARILAGRGHDVTVFCSQWWNDYCDELYVEGVRYRGVTYGTALSSFCTRLPALLARYRPDVVHASATPPQQVLAALTGSRLARAPLIVEWYGNERLDEGSRFIGTVTGRPDRIVTPSELVRTEVRQVGASGDNTVVIPESIDFSRITSVEPTDGVDIVYARDLDEAANLDDFLLGLAEFRQRDWEATVVGDGPLRGEYEREAEKLRIEDRVHFVGNCDRERCISLYRGAHAFVHTARREEFATELLWALACGCVGIVEYQEQSSAHELIEHYDRSYRVSNPSEIADAIDDASECSDETVDTEWEDYDRSAIIERYLSLYRELQTF